VQIEAIEFSDFRNFHVLSFAAAPSLNVLTGSNAQGKTNLLEGLAVLLVGRSFRGVKAADFPRWNSTQPAVLAGTLRRGEATRSLRRVIQPREDGIWTVTGEGCPWARAIAFGWQDEISPAKLLTAFARRNRNVSVKGGLIGGRSFTAAEIGRVAELPPREQLLATLAGGIQAPMAKTLGTIQAPLRELAGLAQALLDKKQSAA